MRPTSRDRSRILVPALCLVAILGAAVPAMAQEHEDAAMHERMMQEMHQRMLEMMAPEYLGENPRFPFSEAVRVGPMLYLSGQIGTAADGLVEGGIQPETRQTLDNIRATLEKYGSSLDQVVKCTVFLADIAEWPAMNEVYMSYFMAHKPARSAVAGSGLALGARVEIECIATVGLARHGM